jgi:hypothetical protein
MSILGLDSITKRNLNGASMQISARRENSFCKAVINVALESEDCRTSTCDVDPVYTTSVNPARLQC